jgi:hypothetical protein
MSDTRSAYSPQEPSQSINRSVNLGDDQKTMKAPIIPPSLRGMVGTSPQYINDEQQEYIRKQQIANQKKQMMPFKD